MRKGCRRKIMVVLISIGALAAVSAAGLWLWVRRDFVRAASELPSVLDQARKAEIALEPAEIEPLEVPKPNGADFYLQATDLLDKHSDAALTISDAQTRLRPDGRAKLKSAVHELALAIDFAFRGAARETHFRPDWSFEGDLAFMKMRRLTQVISASALLEFQDGRVQEGLEQLELAFIVARNSYTQPLLITYLVQISSELSVLRTVELALPHLRTDAELGRLAEVLEKGYWTASFSDAMQGESIINRLELRRKIKSLSISEWLRKPEDELGAIDFKPPPLISTDLLRDAYDTRLVQFWLRALPRLRKHEKAPLRQSEILTEEINKELRKTGWSYAANRHTLNVFDQAPDAAVRLGARKDCLRVLIAVVRYKTRTGRLPARLADVVEPPTDPYTAREVLFRVEGDVIKVYSTGKDKVDNGGKPFKASLHDREGYDLVVSYPPLLEDPDSQP